MSRDFLGDAKQRAAQKAAVISEAQTAKAEVSEQALQSYKQGIAEEVGIIEPLLKDMEANVQANGGEARLSSRYDVDGTVVRQYHYVLTMKFTTGVPRTAINATYIFRVWPHKDGAVVETLRASAGQSQLADMFPQVTVPTKPDLAAGIEVQFAKLLDSIYSAK